MYLSKSVEQPSHCQYSVEHDKVLSMFCMSITCYRRHQLSSVTCVMEVTVWFSYWKLFQIMSH